MQAGHICSASPTAGKEEAIQSHQEATDPGTFGSTYRAKLNKTKTVQH